MKKVTLSALAAALIAAMVAGILGVWYSYRLLAVTPRSTASSSLPSIAWLDSSPADDKGSLLFDLHKMDVYPTDVGFPRFSTTTGWSERETGGTWAIGPEAVLDFRLDSVIPRTLILNTNATGDLFGRTQHATVALNSHTLGRVRFSTAIPLSTLRMPVETQTVGLNRLVFYFDYTVKPLDRWGGDDVRPLAAWFRNITIMDGSFGGIAASIRTIRMFRDLKHGKTTPPIIISPKQRMIVLKPGTIVAAVNPEGRSQLNLEIRPGASADSLSVTAHDLTGQAAPAALITPQTGGGPAKATIQLPEHFATAYLEIDVQAREDRPLRITAPWLTALDLPSRDAREQPEAAETRPVNLVVLILDAARQDRFGCYGTDRPTTPYIDALAADSVVFSEVVALAPYTLCSVPTMATGLSFLEHGVVKRGQSLSGASTTLAEVLLEAGYRTAAFSATPNNSKKLGLAQGYQIFEEAWRGGVNHAAALDPHRLVEMAEAWLEGQPRDRPYHLMVHMVPPHEPYEPGLAFDRFSHPGYKGPADGSLAFIDLFNINPRWFTREDLDQTWALYDGNLLKADDAVGQLLKALRDRSDWHRTAVLVTSDHGEALGEHGRIGHNSHVYEEMIRVPFILKLPDAVDPPSGESAAQPASLADLAPTMAGLAGLGFPGPITGRNLLSETPGRARAMVIRTDHEYPVYGLRTPRWKLVVRNATEMELFDLSEDPLERDDRAGSHKVIAAGLRQILLTRLAAEPLFTAADEVGLTGQDEAMLRTLGYLE